MEPYDIENKESETVNRDALSFALKHLEFISFFELDLKEKNTHSSRFLKAFKSIKEEAQIEVLKYSTHCKK
ncbi:hypothetical protein ACFO3O_06420 [Dokdonia ponticola]|uniref:Uncharacterized protein n=1 Tax=Dokdonia ponticola TaxID=2041041 RepID=A0ABV9HUE6_9FLAO